MSKTGQGGGKASDQRVSASGTPDILGAIDGIENGHFIGWALCDAGPVNLLLSVDGETLPVFSADQQRADLADAGYPDCAFRIPLPNAVQDGQHHTFKLVEANSAAPILGGEVSFRVPKAMPSLDKTQAAKPALNAKGLNGAFSGYDTDQTSFPDSDTDLAASTKFDRLFYLKSNPDVAAGGVDPLHHFMTQGCYELRDPSAEFSIRAFLASHPAIATAGVNAFQAWVSMGAPPFPAIERRTPYLSSLIAAHDPGNCAELIDPYYLYTANEGLAFDKAVSVLKSGRRRNVAFNPLFDLKHYSAQAGMAINANELRLHYLESGWKEGLSPHPLFDPEHYAGQLPEPINEPPLVHYLHTGWLDGLSPHPLFQPDHYAHSANIQPREANPLIHYLILAERSAKPNMLFSDERVRTLSADLPGFGEGVQAELVMYVADKRLHKLSTDILFEPQFYYNEIEELNESTEKAALQKAKKKLPPLQHYLEYGAALDIQASKLFWPDFYSAQMDAAKERGTSVDDCPSTIHHYLGVKTRGQFSPNPLVDYEVMADNYPTFDATKDEAVSFIFSKSKAATRSGSTLFSAEHYLALNDDIGINELCPVKHYMEHGLYEQRGPRKFFSHSCAGHFWGFAPNRSRIENYLMQNALRKTKKILFTSHDASRTGAPGIILRLIKDISKLPGVECYCVLDRGGELLPEFQKVAHTYVLEKSVYQIGPDNQEHRAEIRSLIGEMRFEFAICNSVETRHLAQYFEELGIKCMMLMHEVPHAYAKTDVEMVYENTSHLIFPSKFIRDSARSMLALGEDDFSVIGQGLLNDDFGQWPKELARKHVLDEFSLPEDAFIVLGCGTIDFRKGIDHFVATARSVLGATSNETSRPVYFLWFGYGDTRSGTPAGFVVQEVRSAGLTSRIRLVGSRPDMAKYMAGGDVFFMSSRADPFPCVIHEALASRLPVVYFNEGGGAGELVAEDGFGVPMGDTDAAGKAILELRGNKSLSTRIGKRARGRILENWRSPDYAHRLLMKAGELFGGKEWLEVAGSRLVTAQGTSRKIAKTPSERVYVLSPDWSVSGVNTYAHSLVEGLNKRGWDARLLFTRGSFTPFTPDKFGKPILPSVPYEFVFPDEYTPESIQSTLRNFLRDAPPSIIVPNYDYIASAISPTTSPKTRWVGIAHSDHTEHYEHVYRLGHFWDAIIAVSDVITRQISKDNLSFKDKTKTIYCGVGSPIPAPKRKRGKTIKLVYSGRMVTEQKQVERYIELARELNKRGVPFQLDMLGDGEELDRIKSLARTVEGVTVHGRCSSREVFEFLEAADLLVLMSDYEGLPIVLIEAFLMGTVPVVFPIRSGISEVIDNGKNGIITKSFSVSEVADEIERLQQKPAELVALSAQSIQTIERFGLSQTHMAARYDSLFRKILETDPAQLKRAKNFNWITDDGALSPPGVSRFL